VQLDIFRHLWGYVGDGGPFGTVAEALPSVVAAGYQGVESPLSFQPDPLGDARRITDAGLDLIWMAIVDGDAPTDHLDALTLELERARTAGARFVNCHGGRDCWDDATSFGFYREAVRRAADAGVTICFETHRGRPTYNPWSTDRFVAEVPDLLLTCDLSHWVVVGERLLDDPALLARIAERTLHVHARVGYIQGPQVNDPRAPEHAETLAAHESWWDVVWASQRRRGMTCTTLTPEFGPPPYQPVAPVSQAPLADLVEIVDWMAGRQRVRFGP
jgi:sugar phosphate isomerase/epimerase